MNPEFLTSCLIDMTQHLQGTQDNEHKKTVTEIHNALIKCCNNWQNNS